MGSSWPFPPTILTCERVNGDGSVVENLTANAGAAVSIPGSGRFPGGGNGNPVQYSCREKYCPCPMDKGAWQATVHGVTNRYH